MLGLVVAALAIAFVVAAVARIFNPLLQSKNVALEKLQTLFLSKLN
jgi:hypothetical protein